MLIHHHHIFLLFYYVMYLVNSRFFSSCTRIPHVTTSSSDCPIVLYMCACKCQLFTDEGSRRLPKCLNYCFSVLSCCVSDSVYRKMLRMTVPLPLAVFLWTLIGQMWTIVWCGLHEVKVKARPVHYIRCT